MTHKKPMSSSDKRSADPRISTLLINQENLTTPVDISSLFLNNLLIQIMMHYMDNHTIFISDLHLCSTAPEVTKLFLQFAQTITPETDALYILGDLFQFWAGDDNCSPFNEQIKDLLKKISGKIPVYLMPGNRDFLLGEVFAKESGCILLADPCAINLYGKTTLLTHGDILCTKDIKYRMFRSFIRIPYGIKIFMNLPLGVRLWIANNMQKYSSKTKPLKNKNILAAQPEATKKLLTKFNSKQIIHGHTHIAEIEEFVMDAERARRISLGEWDKQADILIYHDSHDLELNSLTL